MKNIYITEGDPTGISYEIFDKAFSLLKKKSIHYNIIFISSQNRIRSKYSNRFVNIDSVFKLENEILKGSKDKIFFFKNKALNSKEEKEIKIGKPSLISGKVAYSSLLCAIQLQKKMGGDILTLPLSKEWVIASGVKNFKGHTEVFAKEYKAKTFMLMHGKSLKVIPLTTHIPLKQVSSELRKIEIIPLAAAIQNSKLLKSPRIAVCGLNPHAGENGKIGKEESEILIPYIVKMKKLGMNINGPISADSLFIPSISKNFDLILACYHDQGLIPFKAMEGKNGINVTLGLDFLRVSPDHGTAFDIAGKGIGEAGSFIQCIEVLTK